MKAFCCIVTLVLAVPVLASFDCRTPQTFDKGLQGWCSTGDVRCDREKGNGYVCLGESPLNTYNCLYRSISVPSTGKYVMSFDYRFKGRDYALVNDQVDCKLVNAATTTLYEASSCDDLTKAKKWQCFATDAFTMYKDHSYTLSFEHKESRWAGLRLMTCFDIDNIRICKVSGIPDGVVVPAPAGMILSLLGTAMVGFLGKRRLVG